MKTKIDFKKLVWGYYSNYNLDIELEVINWLFKTGLEGDGYRERHGWYESGINQLLYGYSGNDVINLAKPFPLDGTIDDFIRGIFVRGIIAPYSHPGFAGKINEWRKKNKIAVDKYRFFNFPDRSENELGSSLYCIGKYLGRELKKCFFHPEFPNRNRPKIVAVKFSTYGTGYFVSIEFSFWEFGYEPGWTRRIAAQRPGEYIGDFLARACAKLKILTVNTDTDKRTQFEKENNMLDFSERGCFNCSWYGSRHTCGAMEFHGIERGAITNPKKHVCDEWRFNYEAVGKFPNDWLADEESN